MAGQAKRTDSQEEEEEVQKSTRLHVAGVGQITQLARAHLRGMTEIAGTVERRSAAANQTQTKAGRKSSKNHKSQGRTKPGQDASAKAACTPH